MNDLPRCPACEREGRRERVYTKMQAPHRGLPQCQWHGCVYIEGEWIYQCEMCGETVERPGGRTRALPVRRVLAHFCKSQWHVLLLRSAQSVLPLLSLQKGDLGR